MPCACLGDRRRARGRGNLLYMEAVTGQVQEEAALFPKVASTDKSRDLVTEQMFPYNQNQIHSSDDYMVEQFRPASEARRR